MCVCFIPHQGYNKLSSYRGISYSPHISPLLMHVRVDFSHHEVFHTVPTFHPTWYVCVFYTTLIANSSYREVIHSPHISPSLGRLYVLYHTQIKNYFYKEIFHTVPTLHHPWYMCMFYTTQIFTIKHLF